MVRTDLHTTMGYATTSTFALVLFAFCADLDAAEACTAVARYLPTDAVDQRKRKCRGRLCLAADGFPAVSLDLCRSAAVASRLCNFRFRDVRSDFAPAPLAPFLTPRFLGVALTTTQAAAIGKA